MNILPLLTLALFGPTQTGKTTLIKDLGGPVFEHRPDPGRSATAFPTLYNFNLTWPGDDSIQPLSVLDLPGLDDTELSFRNEDVGRSIELFLANRTLPKIDAFLLFNSLGESSIHVKRILRWFTKVVIGAENSIVIVLSKANLAEIITPGLKQSVIHECTSLKLQYAEWSNDTASMKVQFDNLHAAISKVSPFFLANFTVITQLLQEKAQKLQDEDPERYVTKTTVVEVPKVEVVEEDESYTVTEQIPKYSTSTELLEKAREIQKANPITRNITEYDTKTRIIEDHMVVKDCFLFFCSRKVVTVNRHVQELVPHTKEVKSDQPLEEIVAALQKETVDTQVTKTKKVSKTRTTMIPYEEVVKVERHQFDHYLQMARELLLNELWGARRSVTRTRTLTKTVPVRTSERIFILYSREGYERVTTSETEVVFEEKPIEFYVELMKSEMELRVMNTTKAVKGIKVDTYEETREGKIEKHPFEYYLNVVRGEIMREALRAEARRREEE